MSVALTDEQYRVLVQCAFKSPADLTVLSAFVDDIDRANGKVRYSLYVRWWEVGKPLPPGASFPRAWPENQEASITQYTPISRAEVDAVLEARATNPVSVLVTTDPMRSVGWTELDVYFAR